MDERGQHESSTNEQRAGSFGSVQLVAGKAEQIHPQLVDPSGDLAHRLGRVTVKEDAVLMRHVG